MPRALLPFVALLVLAFGVSASFATPRRRQPPTLPLLPGKPLGALKVPLQEGGYVTRYLTAQLDGHPGQELVTISGDPGNTRLRVYTWRGRALQLLTERTAYLGRKLTTVDVDGDGRDELVGIDAANRLATLRFVGGKLRATEAGPRVGAAVGSLTGTTVRRQGPELAVAVDRRGDQELDADVQCDRVLFFRREGGRWKPSWQTSIKSLVFSVSLNSGDYHPQPGAALVIGHLPSEVSESHYELFHWNGSRLARVTRVDSDARTSTGLQLWIGTLDRRGSSPAVVSRTVYQVSDHEIPERGELLQWRRGRLIATQRLPGTPVAVLDLDGSGRQAIVFEGDHQLQLWRPAGK